MIPALSCDSHIHVFDGRFPYVGPKSGLVQHATAADYCAVRNNLGTSRAVVVTPRIYVTDNAVTLDAIKQLGTERTRGVAVVHPDITDNRLQRLHDGGIRGIRFTLHTLAHAATSFEMVETLSARVNELGWHVQLHWTANQIVEHKAILARLKSKIVFDHLARLPVSEGISHPAFSIVRGLLDTGRAWLKLSGPYLNSVVGQKGAYIDSDAVAHAWVRVAATRLVWGSDWPHVTEKPHPPSTLLMLQILRRWADDDTVMRRILVDNPAKLYEFNTDNR